MDETLLVSGTAAFVVEQTIQLVSNSTAQTVQHDSSKYSSIADRQQFHGLLQNSKTAPLYVLPYFENYCCTAGCSSAHLWHTILRQVYCYGLTLSIGVTAGSWGLVSLTF